MYFFGATQALISDYIQLNQQEEESKKNREILLKKNNTDNNSVDTTYATESTDSTSVSVIQREIDNIKTILRENERNKI